MGLARNIPLLATTVLAGSAQTYLQQIQSIAPANLLRLYAMTETSGTVAVDTSGNSQNGTYNSTTVGDTTFVNGDPAPTFDGVNDNMDFYSADFNTNFDPTHFSISIRRNIASAELTDGLAHYALNIDAGANNAIWLRKETGNNAFEARYRAGGTIKDINWSTSAGWRNLVITVDAVADEFEAFEDNSQQGSTQTGLGVWAGALQSDSVLLGDQNTTPVAPWDGSIAYCAIWSGYTLMADDRALLQQTR